MKLASTSGSAATPYTGGSISITCLLIEWVVSGNSREIKLTRGSKLEGQTWRALVLAGRRIPREIDGKSARTDTRQQASMITEKGHGKT